MQVLHSHILRILPTRQTGMIEAHMHLIIRAFASAAPQGKSFMVSVRANAPDLEGRLHQEAEAMAERMNRLEKAYRNALSNPTNKGEALP